MFKTKSPQGIRTEWTPCGRGQHQVEYLRGLVSTARKRRAMRGLQTNFPGRDTEKGDPGVHIKLTGVAENGILFGYRFARGVPKTPYRIPSELLKFPTVKIGALQVGAGIQEYPRGLVSTARRRRAMRGLPTNFPDVTEEVE